jgi:hypothetical protein
MKIRQGLQITVVSCSLFLLLLANSNCNCNQFQDDVYIEHEDPLIEVREEVRAKYVKEENEESDDANLSVMNQIEGEDFSTENPQESDEETTSTDAATTTATKKTTTTVAPVTSKKTATTALTTTATVVPPVLELSTATEAATEAATETATGTATGTATEAATGTATEAATAKETTIGVDNETTTREPQPDYTMYAAIGFPAGTGILFLATIAVYFGMKQKRLKKKARLDEDVNDSIEMV